MAKGQSFWGREVRCRWERQLELMVEAFHAPGGSALPLRLNYNRNLALIRGFSGPEKGALLTALVPSSSSRSNPLKLKSNQNCNTSLMISTSNRRWILINASTHVSNRLETLFELNPLLFSTRQKLVKKIPGSPEGQEQVHEKKNPVWVGVQR